MAIASFGALAAPAGAAKKPQPRDPSRILVKFNVPAQAPRLVAKLGDKLLGQTATGASVIRVKGNLDKNLREYKKLPGVVYAEPNYIARGQFSTPNDSYYGQQWALSKIDALDGWNIYPGAYGAGGGATIAVVDTGVDSSHADLRDGRVLTALGANCLTASASCSADSARDDNGHGTHVAGIAAAATNNVTGVAGMAYTSSIIPVKVLDATASGSYASIANGIMWAANHGARAINLSIGGSTFSQTLCDAVSQATAAGSLVVASAGNNANSAANYPAACPGSVGVSATNSSDALASFSSYGSPNVFVSAPGDSIYSTYTNNSYQTMSGTSMAAPFVTGLAGLLFGELPGRTVADVKTVLATTSDKVGSGYGSDPYGTCACTWSSSFGYGRINVYRALSLAAPASDFGISVSPSDASILATGATAFSVTVNAYNGFRGPVSLSVSGAPDGVTTAFAPDTVSAPGSSELAVLVAPTAPAGTYTLSLTGKSGSTTHTATVTLTIQAAIANDFRIGATPSTVTAARGTPATFVLRTLAVGTFSAPIKLTVTGLPDGSIPVFAPPVLVAPGLGTLIVQTPATAAPGKYAVTITGEANGYTHSIVVTLELT